MKSIVVELEGTLLKDPDPFPYFMLIAFEASGLTRFTILLIFWPIIRVLYLLGCDNIGLKLTIFIAFVGIRVSEIRSVARAVLPKFYMDDLDINAWKVLSQYDKSVVVSKSIPSIMMEWFVKEHLRSDEVIGSEVCFNRFGFATGLVRNVGSDSDRIVGLFDGEKPSLGLGNPNCSFMSVCKEQCYNPTPLTPLHNHHIQPPPVIFHDGRLVKRPTPATSLLILTWIPIGLPISLIRILLTLILPVQFIPYDTPIFGGTTIVNGQPPPPPNSGGTTIVNGQPPPPPPNSGGATIVNGQPPPPPPNSGGTTVINGQPPPPPPNSGGTTVVNGQPPPPTPTSGGVLYVCNHRLFMDPVVLSYVLRRRIPAVTYSISRLTEILSPIPTVRLTRDRAHDAEKVKKLLQKGDLVVCPEGTTCREPYLLRFSALFAELTDRIVPVAVNCRVGFFYPTTARGWKGLDLLFFCMNPTSVYEVTFLDELPKEVTCSGCKSPYEVANYVQRVLGETLGFECTNLTRKDKYRLLAENDGMIVSSRKAC